MKLILLPILAGLIAQFSKFFIKGNKTKFSWHNMTAYSGMPSGHSAMTIALATVIFLYEAFSPAFAVALIVAVVTIRDAVGLRRQIGQHGEIINDLVADLDEDDLLDAKYPHLAERIGHTRKQAIVGGIVGFLVSLIGYYIF